MLYFEFPMRLLLFTIIISLCGCKKDLLHWQLVERIETHTSTDRLNKIFFLNDTLGFVVGGDRYQQSTILTTTDGGYSWSYRNIPDAPKGLYGITQSPSGMIYAIGFDGKMLRSDDTGRSWKYLQLWYMPTKDVIFFSSNRGMVVGGISFNQGYRFVIGQDGDHAGFDSLGYELNDIELVDGSTGFISGYGVILKTTDTGHTWQHLDIANDNFTAIHAYGPNEVWTCGYNGSVFHSSNGGQSWERLRFGNNVTIPRYRLLDIVFKDPMHGFAVGEDGVFIYTDDGGRHWMEFDRFTDAALRNLRLMPDGSLLVCGDKGSLYRVLPRYL